MKREAAVLVFARVTNYGVMLLSPLFLVRLLSVDQFGEYREFMLYAGILQWIAGFSVNDSLLYFIPASPERTRAWIRSSMLLVAAVSGGLALLLLAGDALAGGALFGWFVLPLAIYVLAFANFDFWEGWFLATRRTAAVLVYSTARLALRMVTVVVAAALTRDVEIIVWTMVGTELLRMLASAVAWWIWDRRGAAARWWASIREQWRFCLQTGLSRLVTMLNRNVGAVLIARLLGPVALARFTVATYPEPAVSAVSKSIFMVALPEIVRRRRSEGHAALEVWKRSVSWTCALMWPLLAILVVRAEDLIRIGFGADYAPAAPLLQAFVIVMARNCIDFATPMQAVGETRPLLSCNVLALLVNAAGLVVLMPMWGALGVVLAFALSMLVEPLLLAPRVMRLYAHPAATLLEWRELARLLAATIAAAAVAAGARFPHLPLLLDVTLALLAAATAYLLALLLLRSECLSTALRLVGARLRSQPSSAST